MKIHVDYVYVDLDGTLLRTDLLYETFIALVKNKPLIVFSLILKVLKGRSFFKDYIANQVEINVKNLPYENELVDYLLEKKKQGSFLVLATASHKIYAKKIADHLGFFDYIIATDCKNNLKGERKLQAIREHIGDSKFTYAGNSSADRVIWNQAARRAFVNAPRRDVRYAHAQGNVEINIKSKISPMLAFWKEMRPHQWAKNILVFFPLLTAHAYLDITNAWASLLAFLCFCTCASGVYFLNDLLDLEVDRLHARKRLRPLASGDLPLQAGILGALGLPLAAFVLAGLLLPFSFLIILLVYFILTNAYSLYLKRISTADVMTLAVLYTLRIFAGAAAIHVVPSSWLVCFSIFLFVSLAYLKRYIEISVLQGGADGGRAHGRGYSAADSETMFSLGIANITAAVLVLALYINSPEVTAAYESPMILWFLCFLLLYWGNRIWVGARRGKINEDPVVFAVRDKVSRMIGLVFFIVVVAARYVDVQGGF